MSPRLLHDAFRSLDENTEENKLHSDQRRLAGMEAKDGQKLHQQVEVYHRQLKADTHLKKVTHPSIRPLRGHMSERLQLHFNSLTLKIWSTHSFLFKPPKSKISELRFSDQRSEELTDNVLTTWVMLLLRAKRD